MIIKKIKPVANLYKNIGRPDQCGSVGWMSFPK